MALVAEAGRATPLVQLRQRELARAIGQFAADDVKSNRRRLGLRVDSDQARMPDALRLSLFLLVILMVAIAVAVFAKRSEEHTSELQSLMRISYAAFCLKKKNKNDKLSHTAYTTLNTYYTAQLDTH